MSMLEPSSTFNIHFTGKNTVISNITLLLGMPLMEYGSSASSYWSETVQIFYRLVLTDLYDNIYL